MRLYLNEKWQLEPEALVRNDVSARGIEVELQQYSSNDEVGNESSNDPIE